MGYHSTTQKRISLRSKHKQNDFKYLFSTFIRCFLIIFTGYITYNYITDINRYNAYYFIHSARHDYFYFKHNV